MIHILLYSWNSKVRLYSCSMQKESIWHSFLRIASSSPAAFHTMRRLKPEVSERLVTVFQPTQCLTTRSKPIWIYYIDERVEHLFSFLSCPFQQPQAHLQHPPPLPLSCVISSKVCADGLMTRTLTSSGLCTPPAKSQPKARVRTSL